MLLHASGWKVILWGRLWSGGRPVMCVCVCVWCCCRLLWIMSKSWLPQCKMIYNWERFGPEISYIMLQCLCGYATLHRSSLDTPLPDFHQRDDLGFCWLLAVLFNSDFFFSVGISDIDKSLSRFRTWHELFWSEVLSINLAYFLICMQFCYTLSLSIQV